jgi:hypothetical protein
MPKTPNTNTQTSTHASSTFAPKPTYIEVPIFAIEKGKGPLLSKVPSLVMFGANFDEVISNEP